ncbi:Monooxygenase, FAD-binding protein [Rubellimicrobium mesophilum DSM 19309]|uniref:Monooxygenase, FAD-binding protein n=1 Tax=Rubellimicrobium mesophilum DSM 19309 TaxID=442562 RepID=A0A017HWW0_9RHOB|nr:FAD-dependent monooxygenase [Rubellimicrobium mesophilum]EYD78239.1 Monooxygenase, FAD-binding protein [Rubellimicrobium mesophilum DSM 19309]
MARHDVLIAGAGPTGLVLALWLTRQGLSVRIVDRGEGVAATSRAMVVHARTLELYRQLDLAEQVIADGRPNPALNLWARGRRRVRVSFGSAGADLTPFPFVLVYPQDRHERLLAARLEAMGVRVERKTELVGFEDRGDHVAARLHGPDGVEVTEAVSWLAGCDGAHSTVRHGTGTGFEGGTYPRVFYVADVEVSGPAVNGEVNVAFQGSDFVLLFATGDEGQGRLIGTVRDDRAGAEERLGFDDVSHVAIGSLGLRIRKVNWFSTYRVHHRVTGHFRRGRVFLLGDAAHVHSPAGGQGMNTGIGDAVNLAWKLAAVRRGEAPDALLGSYEAERMAFARTLVATTDRAFTLATAEGTLADLVRTRVVPVLTGTAFRLAPLREMMFRLVSQTLVNYRGGPLSAGRAGQVEGGDRLPWVREMDNHEPLNDIAWQVHVYGPGRAPGCGTGATGRLPLHVFDWGPGPARAGLAQDAAYLVRPDSHVALADAEGSPEALRGYLGARGITFAG